MPKIRKPSEQRGREIRYAGEGGFTEPVDFTHILMSVLASILILVASIYIVLDKLDWLGLPPTVQSCDILIIELLGGVILVLVYFGSRVVKRFVT